jgi:hypothetical protein
VGIGQADAVQAVLEPGQVFFQAEGLAIVDRDDLVHPVAKQETPVHDRDAGLLQGEELAVEMDGGHGWEVGSSG